MLEDFLLIENKLNAALLKVKEQEKELNIYKTKHQEANKETKIITSEKKAIEAKHVKTCEDLKTLRHDNEDLVKSKNALSVAVKNQKKVNQEQESKFTKETLQLRKTVEDLTVFKKCIVDEAVKEKKLKKKAAKKMKQAASKEALSASQEEKKKESEEVKAENEFKAQENSNIVVQGNTSKQEIDASNDSENNQQQDTKVDEPKIHLKKLDDFPEKFKDWSETQRKDAQENNFNFYVEKYLDSLKIEN